MAYGNRNPKQGGGFRQGGRPSGNRSGGGYGGGGGGFRPRRFSSGPREMHKVKCSECGKDAEVPFVPRDDRPVYCKECYMKKKGIEPRPERKQEDGDEETQDYEGGSDDY